MARRLKTKLRCPCGALFTPVVVGDEIQTICETCLDNIIESGEMTGWK